ncbi:hypothetical protein [Escherichia albertii]|uniref:hypothetical protein n=1 Tax=Escherichia albertii TaxID=208962 RepID=UPI0006C86062|nr:hypothetical protein [Escherichia albertii]EFF0798949.1 hypothetical protein [Escherichia albertii]EHG7530421.1 hypothetical protein [Escherichia albertii]MCV3254365.1 hypothetical protein [Escherichia albertii]MCV3265919.1 hypothetical protein [Escherichia albertii]MCZ8691804.1 hypothetical protein [Escherichia albertii]
MACVGVVERRHFAALRDESDARFSVALRERKFWCSFTATRQQSLAAMQAAARKVKGADMVAGTGVTGSFPAQYGIDQRSGTGKDAEIQQV